jgi:hypothetical protein
MSPANELAQNDNKRTLLWPSWFLRNVKLTYTEPAKMQTRNPRESHSLSEGCCTKEAYCMH